MIAHLQRRRAATTRRWTLLFANRFPPIMCPFPPSPASLPAPLHTDSHSPCRYPLRHPPPHRFPLLPPAATQLKPPTPSPPTLPAPRPFLPTHSPYPSTRLAPRRSSFLPRFYSSVLLLTIQMLPHAPPNGAGLERCTCVRFYTMPPRMIVGPKPA